MEVKSKPKSFQDDAKEQLEKFRNQDPEHVSLRASGRDARISKTVRMSLRHSEMLRDESYRRSVESGTKVSEADLLQDALDAWCLEQGIKPE